MKIDVCIPSYHRAQKLFTLLNSLHEALAPKLPEIKVYVYFTDPMDRINMNYYDGRNSWCFFRDYKVSEFHAAEFWNHHIAKMKADLFVYLCDDTDVYPDFFSQLVEIYSAKFPDFSGLVGFKQENLFGKVKTANAAFGAVGKNFINKFPGNEAFCPDYWALYIDTEIEAYARSIGKFHFSENIKVNHYHPCVTKVCDDAYHYIRQFKDVDIKVFNERKSRGLLWGKDFTQIRDHISQ